MGDEEMESIKSILEKRDEDMKNLIFSEMESLTKDLKEIQHDSEKTSLFQEEYGRIILPSRDNI
jgi:hypothetical protein